MRPLTDDDPEPGVREAAPDLGLQQRGVVDHLDVEHADQLLAFGIDRHARGAVLLAEDRQRAVGQRIDVGHFGIADREIDEARVGADVLGLADGDACTVAVRLACADLDRRAPPCAVAADISRTRQRPSWLRSAPARGARIALVELVSCPTPHPLFLPSPKSSVVRQSRYRSPSAAACRSVPSTGTLYSSRVDARRTATVVTPTDLLALAVGVRGRAEIARA